MIAKVPKGNYVLIGGDAGQTGSTLMQEGYHTVLDPLVEKGDIKIVMDQFTPAWKTEPAQANAENALTANDNKVDAFLVSYDGMSLGVLQAIEAAGIEPGKILVTGQDMELSAAQAIVEGRQFGSLWPAPDEMAVAGAKAAVAMAQCKDIGATTTADNGAGQIPWVKTPIYLITQDEMADFVCTHPHWLKIDEVYKNVPDKKPSLLGIAGNGAAGRGRRPAANRCCVGKRRSPSTSPACWRSTTSSLVAGAGRDRGAARAERRRQVDADPDPRRACTPPGSYEGEMTLPRAPVPSRRRRRGGGRRGRAGAAGGERRARPQRRGEHLPERRADRAGA